MWFTDTKESVPTMDNPQNAIILCHNSSPLLVNHKEEELILLNEEILTTENISQGQIYWKISIESPLKTQLLNLLQ